MLLSVLFLNSLVERSFSQPDTMMLPLTSPSPENPMYGTSTSPFQAQAIVKVQVDELDGSAVINLTCEAGSDVAGLTSVSSMSEDFSPSPTRPVALASQRNSSSDNPSSTVIHSTRYKVSAFPTQPAISASVANSSQSFDTRALHSPPLTSATSVNVLLQLGVANFL